MPILSLQKQSQNTDFPNLRPSLDLRFALAKKLDPRITFTRGSTGTYFGPDGLMRTAGVNEPRFDHDPITGQSLGLLIEESRQNLLTYSDDFSNASSWFGFDRTISTNLITAPDGNTTADAFIENTLSNKFHYLNQTLTKAASSIQYTGSIWIKDKGRQVLMNLQSGGSNGVVCRFQPATGQMVVSPVAFGTGWTAGSFSVIPYPNGWYRVSMTATSDTLTNVVFQLATYNTAISSNVYTGDGTSGIYIWGAQLEAGAFPTSYIPTTVSTATRTADLASMTGTNFSSWYNQNEGTIYVNNKIPYTPNPNVSLYFLIFGINAGNRHSIEQTTANGLTYITQNSGGAQYWSTSGSGVLPANTNRKTTYAYSSSNSKTLLSGTSNQTYTFSVKSTTDVYKSMTTMYIGRFSDSLYFLNGTISRLVYYPIQLTNQHLINLTS